MKLRIGLPIGSLEKQTLSIFKKAGYVISFGERSYFPTVDDEEMEIILARPQEMSRYVGKGIFDAGITGRDWVLENSIKVVEVAELLYGKQKLQPIRWVLAVPKDSKIKNVGDLEGKRIATELVNVTKSYLRRHKVNSAVEFSWGATEAKPPTLADAIVELTETGRSLKANNLRVIDNVLESVTVLIANSKSYRDKWKRKKIDNLLTLLQGALQAIEKVGLKMNVSKKNLPKIISILPAMREPTISHLSDERWCAIETVVDEATVREIIPQLKEAGAEGIIEYALNKVIY